MTAVSITIVFDNKTLRTDLLPAWGFACVVALPEFNLLFDTGGDGVILLENMKKSFEEKIKFQVKFRLRKKDGNHIYAENFGVWLKDDKGKIYRAIGVIKNITEWKFDCRFSHLMEKE